MYTALVSKEKNFSFIGNQGHQSKIVHIAVLTFNFINSALLSNP